jgi:predicted esterase
MHGWGGDRRSMLPTAESYARLGAVAITISAHSASPEHKGLQSSVFQEQDRREQIQLMHADRLMTVEKE